MQFLFFVVASLKLPQTLFNNGVAWIDAQSGTEFQCRAVEVSVEGQVLGIVHVGADELGAQGRSLAHDRDIERGVACCLFVSSQGSILVARGFGFGGRFGEFFCQFWVGLHNGEWILRGFAARGTGLRGQLPTKQQPREQERKSRAQGGSKHSHG